MFHERLKTIRTNCKKTQKDLADYLNISPQSISKWEKGECLPSIEYLPKIAEFCKCDINYFFEERKTTDIDAWLKKLSGLKSKLKELEMQKPDEDDVEEFLDWEIDIQSIQDKIEHIEDGLGIGKWYEIDLDLSKAPKVCAMEQYKEFFQMAESVIVYDKDGAELSAYLKENDTLKENIKYICKLLTKETQTSQIALIQSSMNIGYARAFAIIEGFEKIGVITSFDGRCERKIIYNRLNKLNRFLEIE